MNTIKNDFDEIFKDDLIIFLRDYDDCGFAFEETCVQDAKLKDALRDYYRAYFFPKDEIGYPAKRIMPLIFNVSSGAVRIDGDYTNGRFGFPKCTFGFFGKDTPEKKALLDKTKQQNFYAVISAYKGVYYFEEIDPEKPLSDQGDTVKNLMDSQFDDPVRILHFDLAKGRVKDVSQTIAEEWFERIFFDLWWQCEVGERTHDDIPPFIEEHHKDGPRLWRDLPMPKTSPY